MNLQKLIPLLAILALTNSAQVVLTNENFSNETGIVIHHNREYKDHFAPISHNWFVLYQTPWCGFCKKIAPVWDQFQEAEASNPDIKFGTVNCEENKKTCDDVLVHAYPTFIYFTKEGKAYVFHGLRNQTTFSNFVHKGFKLEDPIVFYTPNIIVRLVTFIKEWTLEEFVVYILSSTTFLYSIALMFWPDPSHKRKHQIPVNIPNDPSEAPVEVVQETHQQDKKHD